MKFNVIKRMAKGSVEPLLWVAAYLLTVTGASKLIAAYTEYTADQVYPYVWLAVTLATLLYFAYQYTKSTMEWEQRELERKLKFEEVTAESWEVSVDK